MDVRLVDAIWLHIYSYLDGLEQAIACFVCEQ